jgi:hypothetical protein
MADTQFFPPERNNLAEQAVRMWAADTVKEMQFELARLGLKGAVSKIREERLMSSLRSGTKKRAGRLESAWITFNRHGIFLQRGVGKNRPIRSAAAKLAEKPWITNVLPGAVEKLADMVAEKYADELSGNLRILIPGVINTTVKIG